MSKRIEDAMFNENKNSNKGFTLIELVVVIAILAILALIAVPSFAQYKEKAETAKDNANLRQAYTAAVLVSSEGLEADAANTRLETLTNIEGVTMSVDADGVITVTIGTKSYSGGAFPE